MVAGLAWQAWRGEVFAPNALECVDPTSPFALGRAAEGVVVLGTLAAVGIDRKSVV